MAPAAHLVEIRSPLEGQRDAVAMETWLQSCSTKRPFTLEFVGTSQLQRFLLRANDADTLATISPQVEAQYPQAELVAVPSGEDPLRLAPGECALVGDLGLIREPWIPIKTFSRTDLTEPGADPLPHILAAMEKVGQGERVIAQVALVRAPDSWASRYLRKTVEHPLAGEREQAAARQRAASAGGGGAGLLIVALFLLLLGLQGYLWYRQHAIFQLVLLGLATLGLLIGGAWWYVRRTPQIYDMRLVNEKLMRALFNARVRVIVIGPASQPRKQLEAALLRVVQAYQQYNRPGANGFRLLRSRLLKAGGNQAAGLTVAAQAFPHHRLPTRLLFGYCRDRLNSLEVGGLYHLLQEGSDAPLVNRQPRHQILASPSIFQQIAATPSSQPPVLVGHSQQRGHVTPVYFPEAALYTHKVAIGKSRSGKSAFMEELTQGAMQPIAPGGSLRKQPGVFLMDPHGDLYEAALLAVPPQRMADVITIDLSDTARPVGLNPLDATMGFTCDQATANVMSSARITFKDFWGPRLAYYLSNIVQTLYRCNEHLVKAGRAGEQYTLLDVNPILQLPEYARMVIMHLDRSDPHEMQLLAWWRDVYFKLPASGTFRQEVINPILSKMGVFADKVVLRRIVGQAVTTADVASAVTQGKIVLVNLASRDLEEDAVAILGATLGNLAIRSITAQAQLAPADRRKTFVAIDEFQAIPGIDYERLLSETGKYGCAMLLSTQSLSRLNVIREGLQDIVLANCEQLLAFATNAADAKVLEQEFHRRVTQTNILSQSRLECYLRLAVPGQPIQIASMKLRDPASWQPLPLQRGIAHAIRTQNQGRYLEAHEADRRQAAHVAGYLDLGVYIDGIAREVRKSRAARTERDEARQRETDLRADQAQRETVRPASSSNGSNGHASGAPGAAHPPAASGNTSRDGAGRSHPRSHRANKYPAAAPPPSPSTPPAPHDSLDPRTMGQSGGRESRSAREHEGGERRQ